MLPEEMWLEWVNDEIMCEGAGENSDAELKPYDLFQMAFADYMYENLCYKFLKYIVKKLEDDSLLIEQFEKVISIYGIGGKRAAKIWQLYFDIAPQEKKIEILVRWATTPIPSAIQALEQLKKFETD